MAEPADELDSIASDVAIAHAERLEYELRGAWRAGYDYVHVYQESPTPRPLASESLEGWSPPTRYVLPSDRQGRPDPNGLDYQHTYDLTSVPDGVLQEAIRDA
jgi:hypothetical protein